MKKVAAMAWSANSSRYAVATSDKVIMLYDENGDKKDKFTTRPADKENKSYIIRAICFSPDN